MSNLKISIVQTRLFWEDCDRNLDLLTDRIDHIHGTTDIIVLPEMFTTGFSMNTGKLAEEMNGKAMQWMHEMAVRRNAVITGSLMMRENDRYFNRLIWMLPDGSCEYYSKRHLFRMGDEHNHYTGGTRRLIVHYKGWKFCPLVCYDLRFPVWSRNRLVNGEADFDCLIYVANWPEKRSHAWKSLLVARAIENQAYVVAVNRVGTDGNHVNYSGDSAVIDFKGERLSRTERFGDKSETVEISPDDLKRYRESFPVLLDSDTFELKP